MPRCRSDSAGFSGDEIQVATVTFKSGEIFELQGHLYTGIPGDKLIVYFGGRRSNHAKNVIRAKALLETGASVFIFDYRGFGETHGRATLSTLLEDGIAAYDVAVSLGYDGDRTILYGESLGAAVAAYVSSKRRSAGLILQSGFSSLELQIKEMIPPLRIYPRFMFPKLRLSTSESIRQGHPPLLILHGDKDRVVNKSHAKQLFADGGPQTRLVLLPGAKHQGLHFRQDWFCAVNDFISSLSGPSLAAVEEIRELGTANESQSKPLRKRFQGGTAQSERLRHLRFRPLSRFSPR